MAILFFLFAPIRGYEFSIIDDSSNVYANRYICKPSSQNLAHLWTHPYYDLYMPMTDTVWAMLARIAPLKTPVVVAANNDPTSVNPAVFHTASLLLHLSASALIFGILRRLRLTPLGSAAGALLFGSHPLQVESVAWITGMNNLTSGFFSFAALYLYLCQIDWPGEAKKTPRPRGLFLALATLAFIAALLSKPLSIVVPLFVIALELFVLRRPIRRWAATVGVWLVLSIVCIQVTRAASGQNSAGIWSPFWGRPFIAADALAFYLAKLFLPYELTFDYARNPHAVLSHWWGFVTWIVPAVVIFALFRKWRTGPRSSDCIPSPIDYLRAGLSLFVAGLLPTIGLLPYYSEAITTVSDRYVYLAMLGPALIIGAILSRPLPSAKRILGVIPVVILSAYACLASLEIPIWANMYSMTNDMLESAPNSAMAHECYGIILEKRGKWGDALGEFRNAERLQAEVTPAVDDAIGQCLFHLKQYDEAIAHYKEAIRKQPDDNEAWFQLWVVWSLLNRLHEAESYVRARIARYPDDDRAKFTLGLILMEENRPADALPYVELAARNDPESSDDQYYVGVVFQKLGRFDDAVAYYKKALTLDPQNADALRALANRPVKPAAP